MECLYAIFSWGTPVGIGTFFVLGSVAFYFVSKAVKNLSKIKK